MTTALKGFADGTERPMTAEELYEFEGRVFSQRKQLGVTDQEANRGLKNVFASSTRATFYARKNGGGYRTARKAFTCEQSLCLTKIDPGVSYFDTMEATTWPKTKRICAACAETSI